MSSLWLSIEPTIPFTRLLLSQPSVGTALKARLSPSPAHPRAVAMLLEALAAWYGLPLCAVLDADGEDVQRHPERWARFLGDIDSPQISVEWMCTSEHVHQRDRFLGPMGDFQHARRLLTFAATGQR
jgi:hypothetical protein